MIFYGWNNLEVFLKKLHENIFLYKKPQIYFQISSSPKKTQIKHLRGMIKLGGNQKHLVGLAL